jgi:hypothetical protein
LLFVSSLPLVNFFLAALVTDDIYLMLYPVENFYILLYVSLSRDYIDFRDDEMISHKNDNEMTSKRSRHFIHCERFDVMLSSIFLSVRHLIPSFFLEISW